MAEYLVEFKCLCNWAGCHTSNEPVYVEAETPLEAKEKAEKENPGGIVTDIYLRVWEGK